ncbi:tetratricopeptide repeat protein [candidate division CSSED10-310 bacterium]|uniref:Tetratricopeptide repeat protein n=1 Tax=candidate division CSSED10-310 bacterium TaxID=2855610 RepID=A0ABV6Z6P4_UNCC1
MLSNKPLFALCIVVILMTSLATCGPKISKKDLRLARVYLDTAKANLQNGNCQKAELEAKKSLAKEAKNAEALRILALAYYCQHKIQSAIKEINAALEIDPKRGEFHNDLGGFYLFEKRYQEAIREFQRALDDSAYFEPAAALYNMAEGYRRLGSKKLALLKYQESLLKDPNQDRPYYWIGVIALEDGDDKKAMNMFREALKMNPYNFEAAKELCLYSCSRNEGKSILYYCDLFLKSIPQNYQDDHVTDRVRRCLAKYK